MEWRIALVGHRGLGVWLCLLRLCEQTVENSGTDACHAIRFDSDSIPTRFRLDSDSIPTRFRFNFWFLSFFLSFAVVGRRLLLRVCPVCFGSGNRKDSMRTNLNTKLLCTGYYCKYNSQVSQVACYPGYANTPNVPPGMLCIDYNTYLGTGTITRVLHVRILGIAIL